MTEILNPKVEKISGVTELLATGVAKQFLEKLATPIVGNGTPVSALAKGIAGGIIHDTGGSLGRIASNALLIDAGEDGAVSLMNYLGLSNIGGEARGTEKAWWT